MKSFLSFSTVFGGIPAFTVAMVTPSCILPEVEAATAGETVASPSAIEDRAADAAATWSNNTVQVSSMSAPQSHAEKPDASSAIARPAASQRDSTPTAMDASMGQVDAGSVTTVMTRDADRNHAFARWPMPDSTEGSLAAPSYTPSANTVLDNVTQLVWQRTLPTVYEGCTGKAQEADAPGTLCYWEEAKRYCESPALANWLGGTGWRLPTLIELASLIEATRSLSPPTIDTAAFPETPTASFSSSTLLMNPLPTIGVVNFLYGFVQHFATGPSAPPASVRCVKAPAQADDPSPRYEADATMVLDRATGLRWAREPASGKYDWVRAVEYCKGLGAGWRLPAQKELLTIVDPTVASPLIDRIMFPTPEDEYLTFWTKTVELQKSLAWTVSFAQGWSTVGNGSSQHFVRCVR